MKLYTIIVLSGENGHRIYAVSTLQGTEAVTEARTLLALARKISWGRVTILVAPNLQDAFTSFPEHAPRFRTWLCAHSSS